MIAVTSRRLVAVAAGLLLSCAALAQTAAPDAVPMSPMPGHGPGMMGRGQGPGFGQPGPHGMERGHHHGGEFFLRGLKLTEEQRDKIFAIKYAQMPQEREQHKAVAHARRDLRQMVMSGQYDEARVRTLSEALGRAVTQEAQLRAQAGAKIMQVLTPEQRKQITDREARRVAELEQGEDAPAQELAAM
ncbi:Spy/CpxP family protein refolding chaperone [Ralstonia insidiosa]|uniref:Peptidase n=1 Tax=Ralstonia insidiosa TaxID=190721 RepID=A0A192A395_9RALS|nr:Spy/CpxP family protein refolding chaperone [Ralstonia insidiosa]ANJ74762.1 peptidase [Ralstonia insidiosa]KAB0468926.1 periplasmic heavy metal sensor [Ralstonia insidiosa]MBY4909576.1 Spy/CpxP family protein refolding chaperone [Ralstonia insidiosa]